MLGETLADPLGVEAGGTIKGMSLLPMDTVFAGQKTRTRVNGAFEAVGGILKELSGVELEGYEIHMDINTLKNGALPLTAITDTNSEESGQKADGAQFENIYGSYVHSIFDRELVAEKIVEAIGREKGIDTEQMTGVDYQAFKESQYELLADSLRKHLDMEKIYQILEQGV